MLDECPMTGECPGYDQDRRVCLLHPDDCEYAPADGGADRVLVAPVAVPLDALAGGPCNCLPEPLEDWRTCAMCGVPQAPGKPSCGYCGHRWRLDEAG